ncbi:hypothetical protein PENTCL1PPCAC_13644, partial [Pristionchus entomophagus]
LVNDRNDVNKSPTKGEARGGLTYPIMNFFCILLIFSLLAVAFVRSDPLSKMGTEHHRDMSKTAGDKAKRGFDQKVQKRLARSVMYTIDKSYTEG